MSPTQVAMRPGSSRSTGRLARPVTAVLLLLLVSDAPQPAGLQRPAAQDRDPISRDWRRVSTGELTAVGNASERDLRRALAALEDFRFALLTFFPSFHLSSDVPTMLVVLKDEAAFRRFQPRDQRGRRREGVVGYFQSEPDANYMVFGALRSNEATLRILFHEFTHYVLYRNLTRVPAWLGEGLACFFETFRSDYRDGRALVGYPPADRLGVLRSGPPIRLSEMMSDEGAGRLLRNQERIDMFYSQSWALVHYLHATRWAKGAVDMTAYVRAIEEGQSLEAAVEVGFGTTLQDLEGDLSRYVRRYQFTGALLPPRTPGDSADYDVSRLTESEARYLQGSLLMRLGVTEDAERELTRALAANEALVPARVALARVRLQQDRRAEAIDGFAAAVEADPSDFAARYFFAAALQEQDEFDEATTQFGRAVTLRPSSPEAWFGLGLARLGSGQDAEANAALAHVAAIDSSPDWHPRAAYAAYELGRYDFTAREARHALDQLGWAAESAPYLALIAAVADWRLDRTSAADQLLAAAAAAVRPDSWQEWLVRFMQGEVPSDALVSRARNDDERTEAHGYAGLKAVAEGRSDDARRHFLWVKERGVRSFVEYGLARAELKRLGDSSGVH